MTRHITKAAILLAFMLMAGGFMQTAYGATYVQFNVGGFTFLQPWLAVDPGQTWQDMATTSKPAGYDVASLATVDAAMAAASITAGNYTAFVNMIGGTGSSTNPTGCSIAVSFCDIFLADLTNPGFHEVLFDHNNGSYTLSDDLDNVNINATGTFAGMLYVQNTQATTPEPSLSLLLGGSLMGLGYLAHRRRKTNSK